MKFCTRIIIGGIFFGLLSGGFLSSASAADEKPAATAAQAPEHEITMINFRYEGKVMWLPNPLIVKKGEKVTLTLINNVPEDPAVHGFSIPDFNVKVEVARGTPATVQFVANKAGLFETNCHLHPAHLHGQLLVLEK